MGSAINPVVSGLLHGFGIASQINREKDAQRQIALAEKREQDEANIRDLQTQLSLGDRGYKPSTPDQDAELATGAAMGPAGLMPTDLKQAKYKGQTYVRSDTAEFDKKLKETGALADVQSQAAVNRAQKQLDTNGITISDDMAKTLNLKSGQKILPEKIDDLMRGYSNAKAAERAAIPHAVGAAREVTDDSGNVTSVQGFSDSTVKKTPLGAIGKKTPPARTAPGGLTEFQKFRIDQDNKARLAQHAAAQQDIQDKQVEINRLNDEEQKIHQNNLEIGETLKAGKDKVTGEKVNAAGAKALHTQLLKNAAAITKLQKEQAAHKASQNATLMRFAGRPALFGYGATGATPAPAAQSAGLTNPY